MLYRDEGQEVTIQEAIKGGKRFKRPGHEEWFINGSTYFYAGAFRYEDILAEDWIVEETPLQVTKDQLASAIRAAMKGDEVPAWFPEFLERLEKK